MFREFENRLNKLYTHPLLGDLLDNGDIDYAILDVLEGLLKVRGYTLAIFENYAKQEFMKYNLIRALLDLNILFKGKYHDDLYVEHLLYNQVIEKYVH